MLTQFTSRVLSAQSKRFPFIAVLMACALSGCAAPKAVTAPVFYPPQPNLPRMQFLMAINESTDVEEKKTTFALVMTGGGDGDRVKPIGKPYGVTTGRGKIYVADSGINTVEIIDLKNKTFEYLKGDKNIGKLRKPINLTLDTSGNLYVVDTARKEILMYDAEGNFVRTYGKELQMKPVDVAVDNDSIYALDLTNNEIKVINRKSGEMERSIGKGDLSIPTNMTIDSKGFLYVTNVGHGNVTKFDRDGNLLATIGKLGNLFGEFARPRGVAVDSQGRMYVADAQFYNVQVFNENGRLLMFFGDPGLTPGSMNLPADIATSKENLDYFQQLAAPGFMLEEIIFVTNQYGDAKVAIYGLGEMKGGEKPAEGGGEGVKKPSEPAESQKNISSERK